MILFFLKSSAGKLYFETTDFPNKRLTGYFRLLGNRKPAETVTLVLAFVVALTTRRERQRENDEEEEEEDETVLCVRVVVVCAVHILGVHTADDAAMPHHLSRLSPPLS